LKAAPGKEVCQLLERHGWQLDRISGSHHIYIKPGQPASIPVPVHGNKALKIGILERETVPGPCGGL